MGFTMLDTLAILDVETTGTSSVHGRIIEIGILRIEKGKLVESFESLVNPQRHLPPEITMLTGIHPGQLADAPSFYSLKDTIRGLLDGAVFVAHNARFDYSFIKSEFARQEESFTSRQLCTAKLSRMLYPRYRRHNLDSLIERFGFTCDARHRALGDAKVLWDFLQMVYTTVDAKKLEKAMNLVTKNVSLPPAFSKEMIGKLPESAGVYTFFNERGAPLYIGKSVNLKDRVLSHFADATRSDKEAKVFRSIASIETQETEGELGALLTESRLIKKFKPIYNRQLREVSRMIIAVKEQNKAGYLTVQLKEVTSIHKDEIPGIVAVFRSLGQAKKALTDLAATHSLCKKLLTVEKTNGACFGYQLNTCHGACMGKELPAKYNIRFIEAFGKTKLKQWPFEGAIAIYEGKTGHIVSHWCYLGTVDEHTNSVSGDYQFDYDTYKILSRHLLRRGTKLHIRPYVAPKHIV